MRKCEVSYQGKYKYSGKFHQWGSELDIDGEGPFTVGIIEKDDGSISLEVPESIKFTDLPCE